MAYDRFVYAAQDWRDGCLAVQRQAAQFMRAGERLQMLTADELRDDGREFLVCTERIPTRDDVVALLVSLRDVFQVAEHAWQQMSPDEREELPDSALARHFRKHGDVVRTYPDPAVEVGLLPALRRAARNADGRRLKPKRLGRAIEVLVQLAALDSLREHHLAAIIPRKQVRRLERELRGVMGGRLRELMTQLVSEAEERTSQRCKRRP